MQADDAPERRRESDAASGNAAIEPPPATNTLTQVLVVDDDALMRMVLERVLAIDGFEVIGVPSVAAARIAVRESGEAIGAILCDLTLEDGSGAEFVAWLRNHQPRLLAHTLLITGGAIDPAGSALAASGEFEVIPKPCAPAHLMQRVRAATRGEAGTRLSAAPIHDPPTAPRERDGHILREDAT